MIELFFIICVLVCLSALALFVTDMAKNIIYRVSVFMASFLMMVLVICLMSNEPVENDVIEKEITVLIKYENGVPVDTIYKWK